MNNIERRKKSLRKTHLQKRNLMNIEDIRYKSQKICDTIINSLEFLEAEQIFCYYPLGSEVNILSLFEACKSTGKVICFPKVLNKTTMKFYEVNSLNEFTPGHFNVMEPTGNMEVLPSNNDLMIVPGLVYDKENARIGYGGGFYDRYIQNALNVAQNFRTFGVCYNWQIIDSLPSNEYDQKLFCIITERNELA